MFVRKKYRDQELSEANCHARLSHSKQLLKEYPVILSTFGPLTKRYFTVAMPKKNTMTDCIHMEQPRRENF